MTKKPAPQKPKDYVFGRPKAEEKREVRLRWTLPAAAWIEKARDWIEKKANKK